MMDHVGTMYRAAHDSPPDRPCWHCRWYDGMTGHDTAALCSDPAGARVHSQPERGCTRFEREVGADDDADENLKGTGA